MFVNLLMLTDYNNRYTLYFFRFISLHQLNTHGRFWEFSISHRLRLYYRLLHRLQQPSRNTHNLLPYCRHMCLSHRHHNNFGDPPFWKKSCMEVKYGPNYSLLTNYIESHCLDIWLIAMTLFDITCHVISCSSQFYLRMAGSKHFTLDNAAVFLCPCMPVGVQSAGILLCFCIRAGRGHFPAVSKLKSFNNNIFVSGGEIILDISIVIPTQTTHFALE